MLAYFLLFGAIGFISGKTNNNILGLIVVLALALFLGIHWLLLDLVEYFIGFWVGNEMRKHSQEN